ncbi:hypothetical protein ON010_g16358 [Phytophthora cinnamomi]|nr:hypothetical protein ON010_g16358 [Phytophthora cinnamomi]
MRTPHAVVVMSSPDMLQKVDSRRGSNGDGGGGGGGGSGGALDTVHCTAAIVIAQVAAIGRVHLRPESTSTALFDVPTARWNCFNLMAGLSGLHRRRELDAEARRLSNGRQALDYFCCRNLSLHDASLREPHLRVFLAATYASAQLSSVKPSQRQVEDTVARGCRRELVRAVDGGAIEQSGLTCEARTHPEPATPTGYVS